MSEETCPSCGGPLPSRPGRTGRTAVYCSASCRQRAYRVRQASTGGAPELIGDIQRRARELSPRPPEAFYSDVRDLSDSVGRLRRIARTALDAARIGAAGSEPLGNSEIVTPAAVTKSADIPAPTPSPTGARDETPDETRDGTRDEIRDGSGEDGTGSAADLVDAVRAGDEWTFAGLVEPHRRELQVHCYRMVGSYDDAEDLVQETLLRAWRGRQDFAGRASLRAWLYRIATNTCLDFLRRHSRRPRRYEPVPGMEHGSAEPPARVTWLQPYPDDLLAEVPSGAAGPDAAAVSRETVELVFLAAIQHLPPRQRAVLILRDVLGMPAGETAELLDLSVASVNSALQRARPTLRGHLPRQRSQWSRPARPTAEEEAILRRYLAVAERADVPAMAAMLSEDARLTMPPNPFWFVGRRAIIDFVAPAFDSTAPGYAGRWKMLPTRANRQPAAAGYLQRPGTTVYRAQMLDVLRIEGGRIVEITTFEPHLFPAFGLPLTV
ncbi:sigma-70 family RNA polymerase sigma factor [Plantactinospora solaniradicis]|uniref:RNA polymerase sigma factor n=1 Tax=Plantactinospora solaniradicis TaxID=1723736 RepID=A0ABW1KJG9_9ACTN